MPKAMPSKTAESVQHRIVYSLVNDSKESEKQEVLPLTTDRDGATSATIMNFEAGKPTEFPAHFVAEFGDKEGLLIYHHKDRVVKIFPIQKDDVYLLRIEISDLSRNFLKQLNFAFNDAKLSDIIFTTGVCLRGERCYYECYFVPDQLAISLKELEESLKKISGVSRVVLRKVE